MDIPVGSRNDPVLPANVVDMMVLKPVCLFFADYPDRPLDLTFKVNAIMWDVLRRLPSSGHGLELRNARNVPIDLNQSMLEYLFNKDAIVYVHKRSDADSRVSADVEPTRETQLLFQQSTYRTYPIKAMNKSALSLTGAEFLGELGSLLREAGYVQRAQVYNSRNEELTNDVSNVLEWLRSTNNPLYILLVPTIGQSTIPPQALRTQCLDFTEHPLSGAAANYSLSGSEVPGLSSLFPTSRAALGATASQAPRRGADELATEEQQKREQASDPANENKELSLSLREGVALRLSSAHYKTGSSGLEVDKEVVTALREITELFVGQQSVASATESGVSQNGDELNDSALGRLLRERLSGTFLANGWRSFTDEAVARHVIRMLTAESGTEALMSRNLAREYFELRAKVSRLEALQAARYPWQRGAFDRTHRVLSVIAARSVRVAKFLWWGFHQEVTLVCLYTLFWLWTLRMIVSETLWLRHCIQTVLIGYLAFNVLSCIALNYFEYDLFSIVIRGFPEIYPEDAVQAAGPEAIRSAANEALRGVDLNVNTIVDSLIMRPPVGQIVLISTVSVVPSLLGKWHELVNKRRKKAVDELSAAIEAEKSKISTAPAGDNTVADQHSADAGYSTAMAHQMAIEHRASADDRGSGPDVVHAQGYAQGEAEEPVE